MCCCVLFFFFNNIFTQNTKRSSFIDPCGVKCQDTVCRHFYHPTPLPFTIAWTLDRLQYESFNPINQSVRKITMQAFQKSRLLNPRKSQNFLVFSCRHQERNIKQNVMHANNRAAAFFSSDMKGIRMQSTASGMSRPIYVAATQQHVGKTTTCLSLISGLKKRFPQSIGYIKPVGQQHVPVYSESRGKEIRV